VSTDLGKVLLTAVVTAVVGLLVTESYQSTPWLADKCMRWSVLLRYTDNPERAMVRGEELTSLLADLPTLFKLPTAAGFLLRALAYRAAHRRTHARRQPRPIQHSRGARFRIALAKAVLVILCTGTVFGVEVSIVFAPTKFLALSAYGLTAGIVVASEVVARSRFRPGFIGSIMCTLAVLATCPTFVSHDLTTALSRALFGDGIVVALLSGTAFWLAAALVGALTGKSRYVGFVLGSLVNIMCFALPMFANSLSQPWLWFAVGISGLGIAVGAMAGFAAAVERRTQGNTPRGVAARSGAGAQEWE
jgi:hypothetical protein